MKTVKARDVRNLSDGDVASQIQQNQETLVKLRFQRAIGELTNTAQFRTIRRDIAVLKTVQRERQLKSAK